MERKCFKSGRGHTLGLRGGEQKAFGALSGYMDNRGVRDVVYTREGDWEDERK